MRKSIKKTNPITSRARKLRTHLTPAERKMWNALRHRRLEECKFYRQYPIAPYIADFYCHTLKLVIEIDGDVHAGNRLKDEQRDTFMEQKDIHILRLTNRQVLYEWHDALSEIAATIHELQANNTDRSPSDE